MSCVYRRQSSATASVWPQRSPVVPVSVGVLERLERGLRLELEEVRRDRRRGAREPVERGIELGTLLGDHRDLE